MNGFALRERWRAETLTGLRGDVLDVGTGDGRGLGYVSRSARLVCLEPNASHARALERVLRERPGSRVLRGRAERIPLDDDSVDAAICSTVLCSVDDQDRALEEIHRVLRPGGQLVWFEHVAAPSGSGTLRVQRLITPFTRLFDHGCRPARDTEAALRRSAFTVVESKVIGGGGPFGVNIPYFVGSAVARTADG